MCLLSPQLQTSDARSVQHNLHPLAFTTDALSDEITKQTFPKVPPRPSQPNSRHITPPCHMLSTLCNLSEPSPGT